MIRIKVEIIPHGIEEQRWTVSQLDVINTGETNSEGDHRYTFEGWQKGTDGKLSSIISDEVYFDRRWFIWKLIYIVSNKICENFEKRLVDNYFRKDSDDDVCYNGNHPSENGICLIDGGRKYSG